MRVMMSIVACLAIVAHVDAEPPTVEPTPTENAEAVAEPKLLEELLRRREVDQAARRALTEWEKDNGKLQSFTTNKQEDIKEQAASFAAKMPDGYKKLVADCSRIDAENTAWMKTVVKEHGWPTADLVGKKGAAAAWLLVQHADNDPKFQRLCLELMAELPKGAVSRSNLAYLTDRVLLAEGKKQRYGTQFIPVDGRLKLRPVEDEARLDELRKAMDLPPMADYLRMAEEYYGYATAEPAGDEDQDP